MFRVTKLLINSAITSLVLLRLLSYHHMSLGFFSIESANTLALGQSFSAWKLGLFNVHQNMYTWCTCKDDNWWANSLLWFQTVILCCLFFVPSQFLLPNFPVAKFSVAHFSRCRFFPLPFFRCRYFTHYFCVALFSYPLIFRCRFFTLSNFPVAVSSVTVFFQFPFLPLPFCWESHMHVTQVRAAFPIRLAGILSNCRTGRWLNFYLRLGACLHLNNWCEPTVYLRHWAKHLCPILFLSGVSTITSVRYVDYIFFWITADVAVPEKRSQAGIIGIEEQLWLACITFLVTDVIMC